MDPKSSGSRPGSKVNSPVWNTGHTPKQSPLQFDPPLPSRAKKYRLRPVPSARTFPKLAVLTKRTVFSAVGGSSSVGGPSSTMGPPLSPEEHPIRNNRDINKINCFSIVSVFNLFVFYVLLALVPRAWPKNHSWVGSRPIHHCRPLKKSRD